MEAKYQVIKIEKNYIGVHNFENLKTATELFSIFVEETQIEKEADIDITQAIYITKNKTIICDWKR